jgi:hypothetical protein
VTSGVSLGALKAAAGEDVTAMQALAQAVQQATDSVSQAFASATDVISAFDPTGATKAVTDAQNKLADAQRNLSDVEARVRAQRHQTVASEQQVAKARREVADATAAVAKAQDAAGKTGSLKGTFDAEIASARAFDTDIHAVLERGLDPRFVQRLLEAGPQKAAPVLQALVADHSGRLITMANRTEATLRQINERIVEVTRLTTLAVNSQSDKLARDLPAAVRLVTQLQNLPAPATGEWLAKALGITPDRVRAIATEFGITLPKIVQQTLDQHPVTIHALTSVSGSRRAFADGGYISGPGTPTSDSIPAWVSDGEFVQRAAAVDFYGVDFMRRLNAMAVPRFADGGYVGEQRTGAAGGGARVVVVEKSTSIDRSAPVTIGTVMAANYDDYQRQVERRRRTRAAVMQP